jgi:hypothetical protein
MHTKDIGDEGSLLRKATEIYGHLNTYKVGQKPARQESSDRNFKFKVDKETWDREFKGKTFVQRQSMFDKKFDEQVRQFEQTYGRLMDSQEKLDAYRNAMLAFGGEKFVEQKRATGVKEGQSQSRLTGKLPDGTPIAGNIGGGRSANGKKNALNKELTEVLEKLEKDFPNGEIPEDESKLTPYQRQLIKRQKELESQIEQASPIQPKSNNSNGIAGAVEDVKGFLDRARWSADLESTLGDINKKSLPPASGTKDGKKVTVKSTPPKVAPKTKPKPTGGTAKVEGGIGYKKS